MRIALVLLLIMAGFTAASGAHADESASYHQGLQDYLQGNYDQAVQDFQTAIQENLDSWEAYQGLGSALLKQGKTQMALQAYRVSLALNPDNTDAERAIEIIGNEAVPSGSSAPAPISQNGPGSDKTIPEASPTVAAAVTAHPPQTGKGSLEFGIYGGMALGSNSSLTYSSPFGAGGGLGLYFPLDRNFSLGLMADFYTLSQGVSYNYNETSFIYIENASQTTYSLEILCSAKYRFDGEVKPYAFGGFGLSLLSTSGIQTDTETGYSPYTTTLSMLNANPMFAFGLGLDFPVGKNRGFFVQGKESAVITSGLASNFSFSGGSEFENVGGVVTYTVFEFGYRIGGE